MDSINNGYISSIEYKYRRGQIKGKTRIKEWRNITNADASTQVLCMVQLSN